MPRFQNLKGGLLPLLLLAGLASPLCAYSVQQGVSVYVEKDQTINGNLYAAASSITIDGHVTGDLICAGQSISVSGTVDGDILCGGQSITVTGIVGGSVRVAGSSITVNGKIARNLMAMAANVSLSRDASAGWDALVAAASAQIHGSVGRSLLGAGAVYLLDGPIGQDAVLYLDGGYGDDGGTGRNRTDLLTVAASSRIGGRLEYTSSRDAVISEKAHITGKVIRHQPQGRAQDSGSSMGGALAWIILSVSSALALGLVVVNVARSQVTELVDNMTEKFWPTLGWGTLWTTATPVVAFGLALTVVGIRLALLSFGAWLLLLGLAKILACIALGRLLVKRYWPTRGDSLNTVAALGIVLCWLIFQIPFLGWLLSVVALWWGMGGLVLHTARKSGRMT